MWHVTQAYFEPIIYVLGGTQAIRQMHYLAMWMFIVITAAHIYLVAIEGALGAAADVLLEARAPGAHGMRRCARPAAARARAAAAAAE